jgi:hypothetical protein
MEESIRRYDVLEEERTELELSKSFTGEAVPIHQVNGSAIHTEPIWTRCA